MFFIQLIFVYLVYFLHHSKLIRLIDYKVQVHNERECKKKTTTCVTVVKEDSYNSKGESRASPDMYGRI